MQLQDIQQNMKGSIEPTGSERTMNEQDGMVASGKWTRELLKESKGSSPRACLPKREERTSEAASGKRARKLQVRHQVTRQRACVPARHEALCLVVRSLQVSEWEKA